MVAVLALSMVAGVSPAGAAAPSVAGAAVPPVPVPVVPESELPDLTSATPLDGGEALAPADPVPDAPEQGRSRLGAADVALAPLAFTFKATQYGIYTAPRNEYPYRRLHPTPLVDTGVHDSTGVRMHRIGTRLYDHPVGQASYGIDNLESYVLTQDQRYLDRAEKQAARLMLRARKVGTAWYLPYPFDFNLHGRVADKMVAPWYSAMAQGQAVTLFVRLFEVTAKQTYRDAADGVFASFLRPKSTSTPWVVWVDSLRHLWLEEYPGSAADRTLNGHIFAVYGMWDYWRLTQDDRAKALYQGGLTTVADYFTSFRNPKWISQYCLTHPTRLSDKYHLIHISQLLRVFTITRGLAFLRLAETLSSDYPPPTVTGSVRFAAGTHEGVKFTATGTVAGRRNLTLTRASTAPTNERIRIQGQPGFWYRITAGTLAGYHVQEQFAIVALQGRSVHYPNYPARQATMAANKTFTGFEFAGDGTVLSQVSVTTTAVTSFGAIASARWNSREYLLAATGPLAGRWINRGTLIT
jgi:hypothetical protein